MKYIAVLAISLIAMSASAQTIKPRPLGAIQASSQDVLGVATLARHLPNGSVIVNDPVRRRLLLFDANLQSYTTIADSTSGSINGYGQRPGALIPYVADSTLYLDVTAGSFLVIDPAGKVTRVMSPPRPTDNGLLANANLGFPGFDSRGRMVYRTTVRPQMQQTRDGSISMAPQPDSQPIIRVDLDTRRADTIGYVKTARSISTTGAGPGGGTFTMQMPAPLSPIDDWSLLSDGSIAIIRGRDYHIDWILGDGTKKSSEKLAFDWKRLTDEDKLVIIDSIMKARANVMSGAGGAPMMMMGDGNRMMIGGDGGGRGGPVMMGTRDVVTTQMVGTAAVPPPAPAGTAKPADPKAAADGKAVAAAGAPAGMPAMPSLSASDLPDYMPVFVGASARPDGDANVWIRTTTPGVNPGNVVYDVINSAGVVVDRVDVPKGMTIVGFGKGGLVYLTQREGTGARLVRAAIH